ncbi:hypothetical protein D3C78_1302850 [compost metagenome]
MADHAVSRIDRLVSRAARQAQETEPQGGCNDAVGKILGQTFDRRPADRRLIKLLRIAPDDHRYRLAATAHALALQSSGDSLHMLLKTFLRRKRSAQHGNQQNAEGQKKQGGLRKPCKEQRQPDETGQSRHTCRLAL